MKMKDNNIAIDDYLEREFIKWLDAFIGMRPTNFDPIKWVMEYALDRKNKDIRAKIFASIVRADGIINDNFLSTALLKSGLTCGHSAWVDWEGAIEDNVLRVSVFTNEEWDRHKLDIDLPESFKVQKLIKDYGIAINKLDDLDTGIDDLYKCLGFMMGMPVESPRQHLSERRKKTLRDVDLGVNIRIIGDTKSYPLYHREANTGDRIAVKFYVTGENFGKVVQLIPKDEQQELVDMKEDITDEFIKAFLNYISK